jgi:hypothetical protein
MMKNTISLETNENGAIVAFEKIGWYERCELDEFNEVHNIYNQLVNKQLTLPAKHEKNIKRYYWRLKKSYGEFAIAEIASNLQKDFLLGGFEKKLLSKCTYTNLADRQTYISNSTIRRAIQKEGLTIRIDGRDIALKKLIHSSVKSAAKEAVLARALINGRFNSMTDAYEYYAKSTNGELIQYRQFTNYIREMSEHALTPEITRRKTKYKNDSNSLPADIWRVVERVIK